MSGARLRLNPCNIGDCDGGGGGDIEEIEWCIEGLYYGGRVNATTSGGLLTFTVQITQRWTEL